MKEPTLVILAAGMGSRFGGLKQITPIDNRNHAIIDYSLYDAYISGFRKVAFVIKRENESDFRDFIGDRMEKYFEVTYVYQDINNLPSGYEVPEGRVKPWGTGHAVMSCLGYIEGPFAVINADDFYGRNAYKALYDFMTKNEDSSTHAMVAYLLKNTVTDNGYVSRGICTGKSGYLSDVVETLHIEKAGNNAKYTEDDGLTWKELNGNTLVSMNCWAFSNSLLKCLKDRFPDWLDENLPLNPLKCEYFLPSVVNSLIKDGKAKVELLNCDEVWYGITYKEDLDNVKQEINKMVENNKYPKELLS